MKRLRDAISKFFFRPSDGRTLSLLRIFLGVAMFYQAFLLFPDRYELYGQYGLMQADMLEKLSGPALPGFLAARGISHTLYDTLVSIFYAGHLALTIAFTLGLATRFTAPLLWISQALLINSGYLSSYGIDRYTHCFLFIMAWLPISQHWSLDKWRGAVTSQPRVACTFGLRLIQIFLLMTYIDAGFSKATGTDWWNGEAIWRVLNQPQFKSFDFMWLAQVPWLSKFLGWSTMFIEGFYVIGLLIPRVRLLWVLAIMSLHIGIAMTMGLTLFGCALAAINGAIFLYPIILAERAGATRADKAAAPVLVAEV